MRAQRVGGGGEVDFVCEWCAQDDVPVVIHSVVVVIERGFASSSGGVGDAKWRVAIARVVVVGVGVDEETDAGGHGEATCAATLRTSREARIIVACCLLMRACAA